MRRTYIALLAALALGTGAALVSPYAAITPGALSPGHQRHRGNCLACHTPFRGASRAKCRACHEPAGIALRTSAGSPLPSPRPKAERINGFHRALDNVECAGCHREHAGSRSSAAAGFSHDVLPRVMKTACADCHAAERPRDLLHTPAAIACSTCHGTSRWKPATFEHDPWFRFDANHPARCADCHDPPRGFATYTCYGCHEHAPPRVLAEHRDERIRGIEDCARCHRSANEHEALRAGSASAGTPAEAGDDD